MYDIALAYCLALERCKSILKELLLGLNGMTSTDDVVDNFGNKSNGYQIMSNQDPGKDEALRSRLLSHIFTIPDLKTWFIYAIRGGRATYNVDAARNYVACTMNMWLI